MMRLFCIPPHRPQHPLYIGTSCVCLIVILILVLSTIYVCLTDRLHLHVVCLSLAIRYHLIAPDEDLWIDLRISPYPLCHLSPLTIRFRFCSSYLYLHPHTLVGPFNTTLPCCFAVLFIVFVKWVKLTSRLHFPLAPSPVLSVPIMLFLFLGRVTCEIKFWTVYFFGFLKKASTSSCPRGVEGSGEFEKPHVALIKMVFNTRPFQL